MAIPPREAVEEVATTEGSTEAEAVVDVVEGATKTVAEEVAVAEVTEAATTSGIVAVIGAGADGPTTEIVMEAIAVEGGTGVHLRCTHRAMGPPASPRAAPRAFRRHPAMGPASRQALLGMAPLLDMVRRLATAHTWAGRRLLATDTGRPASVRRRRPAMGDPQATRPAGVDPRAAHPAGAPRREACQAPRPVCRRWEACPAELRECHQVQLVAPQRLLVTGSRVSLRRHLAIRKPRATRNTSRRPRLLQEGCQHPQAEPCRRRRSSRPPLKVSIPRSLHHPSPGDPCRMGWTAC
mmetsp:Transcript_127673/g.408674  ORF Transcript_127673/g.408674 Transcript_127673/m.408674 type:complete len:295 (+) Transcript_127673:430-1314(+)